MSAAVNQTVPGGVTRPAALCTARHAPRASPTGPTQQMRVGCGRSALGGHDRATCEEGAGGTGTGGAVTMASPSRPCPGQPTAPHVQGAGWQQAGAAAALTAAQRGQEGAG